MFQHLQMFAPQSRRALLLATVVLTVSAFAAEDKRHDRLYRSSGSCTRGAVVDLRACTLVALPRIGGQVRGRVRDANGVLR